MQRLRLRLQALQPAGLVEMSHAHRPAPISTSGDRGRSTADVLERWPRGARTRGGACSATYCKYRSSSIRRRLIWQARDAQSRERTGCACACATQAVTAVTGTHDHADSTRFEPPSHRSRRVFVTCGMEGSKNCSRSALCFGNRSARALRPGTVQQLQREGAAPKQAEHH